MIWLCYSVPKSSWEIISSLKTSTSQQALKKKTEGRRPASRRQATDWLGRPIRGISSMLLFFPFLSVILVCPCLLAQLFSFALTSFSEIPFFPVWHVYVRCKSTFWDLVRAFDFRSWLLLVCAVFKTIRCRATINYLDLFFMSSGYRHVILSTFNSKAEQAKKDNLEFNTCFYSNFSTKQTKIKKYNIVFLLHFTHVWCQVHMLNDDKQVTEDKTTAQVAPHILLIRKSLAFCKFQK